MEKCRCVLLTSLSSACQFHGNKTHSIFHTETYTRKTFKRYLWFLKTIWILQQPNVLLRTFWWFVLVWRDNVPRHGRTSVEVFFLAVNTWDLLKYSWSKNVLKLLSMIDIGYPLIWQGDIGYPFIWQCDWIISMIINCILLFFVTVFLPW